ncbi:fimbrial protein, partial [Burkholderia multivorans]
PYVRALEQHAARLPGVSGSASPSRAAPRLSALKRLIQPSSKRS